jgi:uncharacterized membrane protein YkvA (DUF1232 family)
MRSLGWFWALRRDILTFWGAVRHRDMPRRARWVALAALVYLVSPIDLLPDVVPLVGWIDEFIVIPLLLRYALKLTPEPVVAASRARAEARLQTIDPVGRRVIRAGLFAGAAVVALALAGCVMLWPL